MPMPEMKSSPAAIAKDLLPFLRSYARGEDSI